MGVFLGLLVRIIALFLSHFLVAKAVLNSCIATAIYAAAYYALLPSAGSDTVTFVPDDPRTLEYLYSGTGGGGALLARSCEARV